MRSTRSIKTALRFAVLGAALLCVLAVTAAAETDQRLPHKTVVLDDFVVLKTAQQELVRGVAQMLGETLLVAEKSAPENAIVLGTLPPLRALAPELHLPRDLRSDGYWLKTA